MRSNSRKRRKIILFLLLNARHSPRALQSCVYISHALNLNRERKREREREERGERREERETERERGWPARLTRVRMLELNVGKGRQVISAYQTYVGVHGVFNASYTTRQ